MSWAEPGPSSLARHWWHRRSEFHRRLDSYCGNPQWVDLTDLGEDPLAWLDPNAASSAMAEEPEFTGDYWKGPA